MGSLAGVLCVLGMGDVVTTKVLIANFGPDSVLVRTVAFGPEDQKAQKMPEAIEDRVVPVHGHEEFWVHSHQQLMVGERRPETASSEQT